MTIQFSRPVSGSGIVTAHVVDARAGSYVVDVGDGLVHLQDAGRFGRQWNEDPREPLLVDHNGGGITIADPGWWAASFRGLRGATKVWEGATIKKP